MKALSFAIVALWIGWSPLFGSVSLLEAPLTPEASRQLEDKGFEHFYSLEYDQAIATFQKLRDADPNNANWQNHLASAYLYKQLQVAGFARRHVHFLQQIFSHQENPGGPRA